jgi:hypothetical protein
LYPDVKVVVSVLRMKLDGDRCLGVQAEEGRPDRLHVFLYFVGVGTIPVVEDERLERAIIKGTLAAVKPTTRLTQTVDGTLDVPARMDVGVVGGGVEVLLHHPAVVTTKNQ